jgi:hypothetical protein
VHRLLAFLLVLASLAVGAPSQSGNGGARSAPRLDFVPFERGPGLEPLLLPPDERLVYQASLDWGWLGANVGKVTMEARIEDLDDGVFVPAAADAGSEPPTLEGQMAWMSIHAEGDYTLYSMDATISTRILPQDWPRFTYRSVSQGSDLRRRELMIGAKDGVPTTSFRKDTSRKDGPEGQRVWKDWTTREVPKGTLDMLSAVYMARTLQRRDLRLVRFPLIDKSTLWQVTISRGRSRKIETAAGTFDAIEILIEPAIDPSETVDEKGKKKEEKFEGLFGIHGSIHMWVERRTGIPVRIQGDLPVGPLTMEVDIRLEKYHGTPREFRPLPEDD